MSTAQRFTNKVALITGGGSGLGRATALRLAREGAAVVLVGRTQETICQVRQEVERQGGQALAVTGDVSQEADCQRMVAETVRTFGRLDVLVASAGIHGGGRTVVDTPEAIWDKVMDIDLKGGYLSARFAVPAMQQGKQGAIVFISSIRGLRGVSTGMAFQTAKGGLINLTRHMAVAHAAENIRVNCLCPGVVRTPLTEKWLSKRKTYKRACAMHPMNRIGTSEEVAAAVAFLASDEASFITGTILPVDGGYVAAGR